MMIRQTNPKQNVQRIN